MVGNEPEDDAAPDDDAAPERRQTMGEISHTMPLSGDTLGELYRRGPAVTDDGDQGSMAPVTDDPATDGRPTMGTVDHTARNEAVNHVWTRGGRVGDESAAEKRAVGRGDD